MSIELPPRNPIGIANVEVACKPDNTKYGGGLTAANLKDSINEYAGSAAYTGTVVAHEVGHNLGMYHNDDRCGGAVQNGIMNAMAPDGQKPVWSKCDKEEFRTHWRAGCLKGGSLSRSIDIPTVDTWMREMSGSN